MARDNQQKRLNGPEIIDIDAETGKPFDDEMDTSSWKATRTNCLTISLGNSVPLIMRFRTRQASPASDRLSTGTKRALAF